MSFLIVDIYIYIQTFRSYCFNDAWYFLENMLVLIFHWKGWIHNILLLHSAGLSAINTANNYNIRSVPLNLKTRETLFQWKSEKLNELIASIFFVQLIDAEDNISLNKDQSILYIVGQNAQNVNSDGLNFFRCIFGTVMHDAAALY